MQEVIEKQKYENQRRMTDFNLYATKKHERYIELYEKLYHAHNQVLWRNSPLRQMPSFTDYNREDMTEHLDQYNITRALKQELLVKWESNPKEGVRKIHNMMYSQEDFDTRKAINEAVSAHLQTELYLPHTLSGKIDSHITQLNKLAYLCNRETREGLSGEERQAMQDERNELKKTIEDVFPDIVQKLRYALLDDSSEE